MLLDEERIFAIAPGMNRPVVSFEYDEKISFPAIYLEQPLRFRIRGENDSRLESCQTPYQMAHSEMHRTDRRGVKPEHIPYMAMKVSR